MLNTPVLFLIYRRPSTTQKVFNAIREARPNKLFVAANGPNPNKESDIEKCEETRNILRQVDWDCELVTLFREEHLTVGLSVSRSINWFFDQVEEGIILEDDCVPGESFFSFCNELLHKYRDNEKIMHIGGINFQNGRIRGGGDYYFSAITHIWGWATWKRSWEKYDFKMKNYSESNTLEILKRYHSENHIIKYWLDIFNAVVQGRVDTWDYQWAYAILKSNGACIVPNRNLVSNIGFGKDAIHTNDENDLMSNLKIDELKSFNHPNKIVISKKADIYTHEKVLGVSKPKNWIDNLYIPNKISRIKNFIKLKK